MNIYAWCVNIIKKIKIITFKSGFFWEAWLAQLVKHLTLDLVKTKSLKKENKSGFF